jgi:Flp pilus assembly protein TadD
VLGFAYDRLGDGDAAAAALERASALDPEDYETRSGLARAYRTLGRSDAAAEQEAIGRTLAANADEYGHACLEAVLGNADAAVELLEAALAKGQLTAGWARIDPELVFLQDSPRYQRLVV